METMTKMERVKAALEGKPVDRPPFTAWGPHFNLEDRHTGDFTKAVIAYEDQHDFDILKVMQNGLYFAEDFGQVIDPPQNSDDAGFKKTRIPAINSVEDMGRLTTHPVTEGAIAREVESIRVLAEYYKDKVPVLATASGPYRMFNNMSGVIGRKLHNPNLFTEGTMADFIRDHEELYFEAMEVLTEQLIMNMNAFLDAGAAGFFFCPGGTYPQDPFSDEEYLKYIRPYDERVLKAVYGRSFFTMLHICSPSVTNMDYMLDLPAHAINWEDSSPFNPTIEEVRAKTDKVLMGGVDRNADFYGPSRERVKATLKMKVKEAMRQAGNSRFVAAVGCESPREITHRFVVWREVMAELADE